MPTWGWVLVGVAVLVVIAVSTVLLIGERRRTARLQQRFGPEYDRAVQTEGGRRDAEARLRSREQRRSQLDIRPLAADSRRNYEQQWQQVQMHFVDEPFMAVGEADRLIQMVMREEGYPMEEFDRRAEDLSVDHPRVIENYRQGHKLALASAQRGPDGTEDLRQAMQHYRSLFEELVEVGSGDDSRDRQGGADLAGYP